MRTGTTHREEALKAIERVAAMLEEPVDGINRVIAHATLTYAANEVRAIQEVKRQRKTKEEVAP